MNFTLSLEFLNFVQKLFGFFHSTVRMPLIPTLDLKPLLIITRGFFEKGKIWMNTTIKRFFFGGGGAEMIGLTSYSDQGDY